MRGGLVLVLPGESSRHAGQAQGPRTASPHPLSLHTRRVCFVQSTIKGSKKVNFEVILELSDEEGYTVYVPSLPSCISEGETFEEAVVNIQEAIKLYLEPVEDD